MGIGTAGQVVEKDRAGESLHILLTAALADESRTVACPQPALAFVLGTGRQSRRLVEVFLVDAHPACAHLNPVVALDPDHSFITELSDECRGGGKTNGGGKAHSENLGDVLILKISDGRFEDVGRGLGPQG